jgi:hypothetical protein
MDPFDLAKGLRARQAANIGDALNRSAGTTALTVQAYTGSFGPSAPVTRPFNQQYVDELANTQRFEIMKTANEKFKGWLEDDTKTFADLPAALVVDNLPHWVDYSDALEDALQSSAGKLMTVQGKNILQMGQSVLSSVGAVGKVAFNDPTGLVYKLDVYTQIARGEQIDPATLSRNHVGKSIADDVRAFMTMTPDEQQAHMNAVTSEVLRRQDVMDEVRRTFQQYAKHQFANNYGRAVDLRDIDDLYGFVEYAANAGSSVVASAGLVTLSFYLGSQAAPAVGVAAAFSTSALLESAEIVGRLAEEGRLNQYTAARAVAAGMLSGGVEMAVGAPATFMRGTSSRLFTEAMGKRALRRLGRVAGRSFMEEGAQEALQAYIQQVGAEGIEGLAPDYEGMWEIINSAAMGALGGGMFGSAGSLRYSLQARRAAKGAMKADAFESTMNAVADTIKSIPEAGRSPEVVSEITGALGGADHQIFYQATDLADFADKNGISLPQLLNNLSIGQRDFEAALSDGGPVATTLDRVVAHGFTLSSGSEFFIQNATTADMPFSPAQAKELKALLTEKRAEIQKQAEADALTPTRSAVYSYIKDQVIATGKNEREAHALGVTWTSFFDTLSTYTSTPVDQLLSSYGIKIVRGAEATAPPGLQQQQTPFPPSSVVKVSNPQGDWLASKQRSAERGMAENPRDDGMTRHGLRGSATAYTEAPLNLPTEMLAQLAGVQRERRVPGEAQYDALQARVDAEGFTNASPILIRVNHKGEAFIVEGNTRVAVAAANDVPTVRAEVQWMNGAEEVDGPFSPQVVWNTQTASVYMQTAAETAAETAEERLTEGREPPREPRRNTYMGVGEQYTVANPSPDAPAFVRNGGMILNSTNEGNADAQSAALDALLEAHPDPLVSEEAWVAYANDAFSLTRVPMPPWRTINIVNEGPSEIGDELDKLSAGMIRDAEAGLKTAQEFGEVYASGQATPDVTAKAFLWSFLSRGVSPYVQEGAFLDAITSPVLTDIMQRALVEGWSQSLNAEYTVWAESAIPPGSPGRGTQHNLNAFGRNFMAVMTRMHPDAGGRTGLQIIHDMIADGTPSAEIRREFLKRGSGAGIDNKVVSFTLLLLGRTDVIVLDRVQVRNQFNDGRFDGQNIYDAEVVDGQQVTGSAFAEMTFGHKGLLYYEAMERALQPIIEAAYAERGMEGSLGRYHWDSWLAASNQEVGHASVEGLLRDAQGIMQPYSGAFVRQGKYTNYDYGFRYGILPDGSAATVVETLDGSGAIVLPNEVLANNKHPTRKTLSSLASKAKKRGSEYGVTQPWTAALTAEEQAKYDEAIRSAGSPAPDFWADPADAVRPTDEAGQVLFQLGAGRGTGGYSSGGLAPLAGAPKISGATGPDPGLVSVAEAYAKARGVDLRRQPEYVEIDEAFSKRLADAYEAMAHDPGDPDVQAAYADLIAQTRAQYDALVEAGYKFWFYDADTDPYAGNPWNAMRDLRQNRTMAVYATADGFGTLSTQEDVAGNPLLADTGLEWHFGGPDGPLVPVTANDLFRAVHDAFGHGLEGAGFRAQGEENAWQAHARLFTGPALAALTTETRGQNSWLNFGPHGESNRAAKVEATVFADQKTGLLPEWAWALPDVEAARAPRTPEFEAWFGDSKVVDEEGNPLVVYHGTSKDKDFTSFKAGRHGVWFTSNPGEASAYAEENDSQSLKMVPGTFTFEKVNTASRVIPAYLSIQNPYTGPSPDWVRTATNYKKANSDWFDQLKTEGYDGWMPSDQDVIVVFNATQVKSIFNSGTFDPNDPRILEQQQQQQQQQQRQQSGVQGQIEFPAGGLTPGSETVIRLFNADNPTTLLHESGHFFFEMYRVLAAAPNATPQIKAMWEKVNSGLGREAGDVSPLSTDHHEYLARSFEVWFMKGEAPSVGLRAVFRQFKNWLTRTYQAVQSMRGMKMNDDIVDFMERMLATEEEIALARDDHDLGPMFSERPIGMSDEGWQTYRDIAAKEEEEAEARLLKRVMKGLRKRHKQAVEDLLVGRRAELMQSKAFRTVDKVTAESRKDMRLNRSQLVELVGEDVVKRIDAIPVEGKYKFAVNGGGDIYDVADLLGYRDPGVMINDIVEFMDAWDAAPAQADEDHKQMFGDALTDGSLRAQAEAALHTDASTRRLALDMKTVKQMLDDEGADVPDAPTAEAMRALGKRRFADKKVVSANKPSVFLTQERKYNRIAREKLARLAGRAAGKRLAPTAVADLRAAYSAMQKAALNHVYYIEAKRLEDSLQALANREKRVRKAYSQKKLLEPYGDYLTALYEMFGLTKLPKDQLPRTVDLKVLMDSEASRTDGLDRTSELNPAESTIAKTREAALVRAAIHYNSFTVSEFEDLKDTLVNLEKVAREEMKILREGNEVSYRSIRADLEATLSTFDEKEFGISETDSERKAKVRGALVNSLKTVDTLLSELDRYTIGSFQKNLAIPVKQALARYTVRDHQSKNEIGEIFKRWLEGINVDEKVKVDELGGVVLKRRELIAMAQNAGNRLNWQRLIGDRRLGNFGDNTDARAAAIEAALRNHLSENEWHYVQDMWSYINGFWPEIAALERRLSGVTPQKIDEEIMVSGLPSFVKGGYYPIYYDPRLSASVTENDLNETLSNMRSGRATRAQTKNGHTKARMEVVDKVLSYDITAPIRHVSSVLFDLEMREPVAVTYRLLNDKGMKELFQRKGLEANRRALVLWIQDVANADRSHVDGFNALLRHFRGGLSVAKMGLSYATLIQQPLGITASTAVIGRGYTLNAVGKYVFNGMGRSSEAVQAMSNTMKERQATFERDYQWMMDSLDTDPVMSKWNRVRKFMTMAAFYGMQKAQYWTVDVPTWMAGYDRALAEGHVGQAAADVADLYLERAQGSGMLASRSAIERGTISETSRNSEFARLSTVFGSYMMSGKFNAALQKVGYMRQNPSAGNIASTLVDLITMFSVETALSLLVTGRWPDEEEIEDWEGWGGYYGFMIWQTGATVMAGVPLLRDVVSAAEGFGGGGAQASAVESSVRLLKGTQTTAALLAGIEEDEGKYRRAVRDILQGAGVIAKLPTIQLERILTAIYEEDLSLRSDISPYDLLTGRRD